MSYSYSRTGVQKRMEQTSNRYGNRISILRLWQPGERFEYALAQGGFKGESYIQVIDWLADKAAQTLAQTGRLTVVVQDNGSLHTSLLVRQQWARWQEQGLFIFFLPSYCSEIVGIFILIIVSLITTFIRNASSPSLAREARVVGKRLDISGGKSGSSTYYYATFEFPDGSREEFGVGSKIYGMLVEGDLGTLHSQGTYVWEFNRRI